MESVPVHTPALKYESIHSRGGDVSYMYSCTMMYLGNTCVWTSYLLFQELCAYYPFFGGTLRRLNVTWGSQAQEITNMAFKEFSVIQLLMLKPFTVSWDAFSPIATESTNKWQRHSLKALLYKLLYRKIKSLSLVHLILLLNQLKTDLKDFLIVLKRWALT